MTRDIRHRIERPGVALLTNGHLTYNKYFSYTIVRTQMKIHVERKK